MSNLEREKTMRLFCATVAGVLFHSLIALPSVNASVTHTAAGVSAKGVAVTFEAELTIAGDFLTIALTNNSPVSSLNPDDVLGSYYFDIADGLNNRPTLTYVSATGDTYLGDKDAADSLDTAGADLMAVAPGDYSWQYKTMDPALSPFMGFGIGTVGNSNLSPNNFMGNIVDGIDFSIYKGNVTTANLDGKVLVKDTATFVFSGLTGFTESDISSQFAFGLGTAPDSLLTPEPASVMLMLLGGASVLGTRRSRS